MRWHDRSAERYYYNMETITNGRFWHLWLRSTWLPQYNLDIAKEDYILVSYVTIYISLLAARQNETTLS